MRRRDSRLAEGEEEEEERKRKRKEEEAEFAPSPFKSNNQKFFFNFEASSYFISLRPFMSGRH